MFYAEEHLKARIEALDIASRLRENHPYLLNVNFPLQRRGDLGYWYIDEMKGGASREITTLPGGSTDTAFRTKSLTPGRTLQIKWVVWRMEHITGYGNRVGPRLEERLPMESWKMIPDSPNELPRAIGA